jgi:hypothetical protein
MAIQRSLAALKPVAFLFPLVIMGGGALFAPLHTPVESGIPPITVTPGILIQVVLLGGWLLAEYRFAASRETAIKELQADAFRSIALSLAVSFAAGWLLALGKCPWYFVAPSAAAILDAFLTANQGLNNAAQKPLVAARA